MTRPPTRNSRRRRTSPKRAASPSTDAGFWVELTATDYLASSGLLLGQFAGLRGLRQGLHRTASLLDGLFGALGGADALERHGFLDFARQHDLRAVSKCRDDVGLLQGVQVDDRAFDLVQLVEPHFGLFHLRTEADLGQAALQRHLAAFEAHLVVSALASALALHAAATGLALAGGSAASHAQARLAGAHGGFHVIESHGHVLLLTFRLRRGPPSAG